MTFYDIKKTCKTYPDDYWVKLKGDKFDCSVTVKTLIGLKIPAYYKFEMEIFTHV